LYEGESAIYRGRALTIDMRPLNLTTGRVMDGVLGWDFFSQWCVRLDYSAKKMTLRPREQCVEPAHGRLRGNWTKGGFLLPSVITFANGRKARARLILDTGDNGTLTLAPRYREAAGVGGFPDEKTDGGGNGVDGKFGGNRVGISALDIGQGGWVFKFDRGTTALVRRSSSAGIWGWWKNGLGAPRVLRDGGIGNQLLERVRTLTFDPVRKMVHIGLAVQAHAASPPF
jgi:hypothetical protein